MASSLIIGAEVVGKAPTNIKFSPTLLERDHVNESIYANLIPYIGKDLYAALLADKKSFVMWEEKKASYDVDALVYSGVDFKYYKRTTADGNARPDTTPDRWTPVDPFTNADYNALWYEALWRFCAYCAVHDALPFIWASVSSNGVGVTVSDTFQALKLADVNFLQGSLNKKMKTAAAQCHDFICAAQTADDTKFTQYTHCTACNDKKRTGSDGTPNNMGVFLNFNKK